MKDARGHGSNPRGTHQNAVDVATRPNLTRDQLERMDIATLDRMAYGHTEGDRVTVSPNDLKIKYPGDLENPQDKFAKGGMGWVKSVDFSKPIDVSIGQDGRFSLEDGHHRYFAAKKLGRSLTANVSMVTGKPIETILQRQGGKS